MNRATRLTLGAMVVAAVGIGVAAGFRDNSTPRDKEPAEKPSFAEDRVPATPAFKPVALDAERTLKYLKQLCDLGPRVSATEGMKKQQELLTKHFEKQGAKVTRQEFKARQVSVRHEVPMTNLIVSWFPDRKKRVILCSHYDTRPSAHEEPRANWNRPFVSANDGTSGVALLMELGHHMKDLQTGVGVDFVFFDGEEYIFDMGTPGFMNGDRYFLGSEYFAEQYTKKQAGLPYFYDSAILLDLMGHAHARLAIEGYSWRFAPNLVKDVWGVAQAVGAKSFVNEFGFRRANEVLDDHLALIEARIPAIDIIDFDYEHWHRLSDTPDKVSGKQLVEVGTVLMSWLQIRK